MTESVFGFGGVSGAKDFVDKHGFEALYAKAQKITSDKIASISEELGKVKEQRESLASRLEEVLEDLEELKKWKLENEKKVIAYDNDPDKLVQRTIVIAKENNLTVHSSLTTGRYIKKENTPFSDFAAAMRQFETPVKRTSKSPVKSNRKFTEVIVNQKE